MLYVFNTWVIANLIHPVFLYIFFGKMNDESFHVDYLQFYFFSSIFSFLFSIPVLIIAWFLFYGIRRMKAPASSKFISWTFFAALLPLIIVFLIATVFNGWQMESEEIKMILPSLVAATISILIRARQFFKVINQPPNFK